MNDRPRVLLVTPAAPVPPTSGGAQRTALLFDALSAIARVDTFLLAAPEEADRATLMERYQLIGYFEQRRWRYKLWSRAVGMLCPELHAAMPDSQKCKAVSDVLARSSYDIVVLRYSATACQLRRLRNRHPAITILVDVDDALAQLLTKSSRGFVPEWMKGGCARATRRREREALLRTDGLWIVGAVPASLAAGPPVVRLPNIAFYRPTSRVAPDVCDATVEFLGVAQFTYAPNLEGFDWFLRHVWPLIRWQMPRARLRLVGRTPSKSVTDRWSMIPGVVLAGMVDAVEEEYRNAWVAVAPIRRGGGTKIKVVEALTFGVPCVCTSHAATDLDELTSLIIADDEVGFARLCVDLATDTARRASLALAALAEVNEHFSPAHFADGVRDLLAKSGKSEPTHEAQAA